MQSPEWYLRRLSLMSVGEIGWRVRQSLADAIDRQWPGQAPGAVRASQVRLPSWPPPARANEPLLADAGRVLNGEVELFGEWCRIGESSGAWSTDPVSGVRAPLSHGKFLDYRDVQVAGSARNTWEINRHFQFVTLAQAWGASGEERFRSGALRLIDSWLRDSPYPLGINWVSALEHGIRLINWYIGSRMLGCWNGDGEPVSGWLDSIYQHCRFIERNQSRHSSANNHLIGEMAGLYIAATAWPCWDESAAWRQQAKRILEQEIERQVHGDGVSREQTTSYQIFVLQFALLAGLVGERAGDAFPREYWSRLQRMTGFLRAIRNAGGRMPDFGDADDGVAFKLSRDAVASRLDELLDWDDYLAGRNAPPVGADFATAWLAAGLGRAEAYPRTDAPPPRVFPEGGYYVLGENFGTPGEVSAIIDAGPLGYLSIAAHGHADCLSLVLSLGGREVLVDPGTYCYHSDPEWRDYFRSTAAHNTVRVDGVDQSVIGGAFMWLQKAEATVESCEPPDAPVRLRARHDGYRRLRDPVTHTREVRFDSACRRLTVDDTVACAAAHSVERFWHFAESWVVRSDGPGRVVAESGGMIVSMDLGPESQVEILRGSTQPRAGWISRSFGSREPTTTVVARDAASGTTGFVTTISWSVLPVGSA
jgi:uncharacterized heparinase superfamily protein